MEGNFRKEHCEISSFIFPLFVNHLFVNHHWLTCNLIKLLKMHWKTKFFPSINILGHWQSLYLVLFFQRNLSKLLLNFIILLSTHWHQWQCFVKLLAVAMERNYPAKDGSDLSLILTSVKLAYTDEILKLREVNYRKPCVNRTSREKKW